MSGRSGHGPMLVTGGTGTLGRHVVEGLVPTDREIRTLSRSPKPHSGATPFVADLETGVDLTSAFKGVETVVHCAGSAKGDEKKARNLIRACSEAGVSHICFISVVGADRVPVGSALDRMMFGYFAEKRGAEIAIEESGIPWTTLRATQFHDLTFTTIETLAKLPVVPVFGKIRFQPIDAEEVASRLVELALGAPNGLVPAIGGPHIYQMDELARSYLEAWDKNRPIISIPLPGKAARAMRDGVNLAPDRAVGRRTWEKFVEDRKKASLLADARR